MGARSLRSRLRRCFAAVGFVLENAAGGGVAAGARAFEAPGDRAAVLGLPFQAPANGACRGSGRTTLRVCRGRGPSGSVGILRPQPGGGPSGAPGESLEQAVLEPLAAL